MEMTLREWTIRFRDVNAGNTVLNGTNKMFASSQGDAVQESFGFLRVPAAQLPKVFGVPVKAQRRILWGGFRSGIH
jgi:hypothetical protein